MTTLEKIKAEFIARYPKNYANEPELGGRSCVFSLNEILQIIDKYAEQEPCTDAQERYEDLCEYFGDAKDILKSRKDFKAWLERIKWYIHKAEELYEKYEHKQEPCDDVVSRQAVLNEFYDVENLYDRIKQLPSVRPQEQTGHWIKNAEEWDNINPPYICSECMNAETRERKFCSECGAKMVKPQESEEV
jgi:hypothetical protein